MTDAQIIVQTALNHMSTTGGASVADILSTIVADPAGAAARRFRTYVALGEPDLAIDGLQLLALGGDLQRNEVETEHDGHAAPEPAHTLHPIRRRHVVTSSVQGCAEVRRAVRKVAERARGLRASSSSPARTGRPTSVKLGSDTLFACGR